MQGRMRCEFSLIRYVPDVVKGEFANIGVVLRGEGGRAEVRFTRDWSRVRCLDATADTELLESLETELAGRLEAEAATESRSKPVLDLLDDTLSNCLQISERRATLAESFPAEMEQLLRMYVEPIKTERAERGQRMSGRAAIQRSLRTEFERTGTWKLMRKKIAAAEYTQAGDPLKIDCGYRNGRVRLFQAVSLQGEAESAKSLAYSAEALAEGVLRVHGAEMELTAIVEPRSQVRDEELYEFGVAAMENRRVRVLTVADLPRVAETARRELRG